MNLQEEVASRIGQYIPDLRKQIKIQMQKQFIKTNKQILQQRTNQIRQRYTNKLKQHANKIKQNINNNLILLHKQIEEIEQEINMIKNKKLNQQQKIQLIQSTVNQIVQDSQMLEEIKIKLYPKVQENVLCKLETDLHQELEEFQKKQQLQLENLRGEWEEDRYEYWKVQSQRDLQVLAQQHKQLQCKKSLIHQSLTSKKIQRDQLLRQQNNLIQTNNQIAYLKNQIKLLS